MARKVVKTVNVRGVEIGGGMPKICVPIVGKTEEEILAAAAELSSSPADVVEWRIDWFDGVFDRGRLKAAMEKLRAVLGAMPLLVTFRTASEGGEKSIKKDDYVELNCDVASWGLAELIDAEAFTGEPEVKKIVAEAHRHGVKVVASNHDFSGTPAKEELVRRLRSMQELGADIPKLAVTPRCPADVLTLLSATEEMASNYADRPIITMSMKGTGLVSRLCGEVFGSALTFGAVGRTSAPGQIDAGELKQVLELFHENL